MPTQSALSIFSLLRGHGSIPVHTHTHHTYRLTHTGAYTSEGRWAAKIPYVANVTTPNAAALMAFQEEYDFICSLARNAQAIKPQRHAWPGREVVGTASFLCCDNNIF